MDVEDSFKRAVAIAGDPKNANAYDDDTKLKFYSLFKQVKDGDIPADKPTPSIWQVVPRAKHNAWLGLKGMSAEEAKRRYVETLQKADSTFIPTPLTSASTEKHAETTEEPAAPQESNTAPAKPSSSNSSSPQDVLFWPAVATCGGMVGLGVAGILLTACSWSTLFFLSLVGMGMAGVVGSLLLIWDEKGLVAILPRFIHKILFDMTLLEFIVEDNFFAELRQIIVQILPAYLANDEAKMYETLSLMTPRLRQVLTTTGFARFLSPVLQRILLPRALREQYQRQPAVYRLPAAIPTNPRRLEDAVTRPEPEKPDLDRARALFREMFNEVVSKRNVEFVLTHFNPKRLQQAALGLTGLTLIQLGISAQARQFLFAFIRNVILLATVLGAGASAGMFAIWVLAKTWKKKNKD